MKGKKMFLSRCGCCVFYNFKHKNLHKEHMKEIKEAVNET